MNKYNVIMHAERMRATLESINNGDSAATDETALFISEFTLERLIESSEIVMQYLMESFNEECEKEFDGEYIEIPLDTHKYIEDLSKEQAGAVFKNICLYFFDSVTPECRNDVVGNATMKIITRIEEYSNNGK